MIVVFLGPPGVGKGTHAGALADQYDMVHLATGDILRAAVREGTEMGLKAKEFMDRGDLVPDDVIIGIVHERMKGETDGFLFDGFPRTRAQAEDLEESLDALDRSLDAVVCLTADDAVIVERLGGRRVCPECQAPYHVESVPPRKEGRCDRCDAELVMRKDDRPEAVRERLHEYHGKTEPLVEYYEQRGVLRRVDGTGTPDAVRDRVRAVLDDVRGEAA